MKILRMKDGGCAKTVSTVSSGDLEKQGSLGIVRHALKQFPIVKTAKPD